MSRSNLDVSFNMHAKYHSVFTGKLTCRLSIFPKKSNESTNDPTIEYKSFLLQTYSQVPGTVLLIFPHELLGNIISFK